MTLEVKEPRAFREHRETLALEKWVSRAPSDLPFIIYLKLKLALSLCVGHRLAYSFSNITGRKLAK